MNGSGPAAGSSRAAALTLAWRFASFRSEGFPVLPVLILSVLVLVAVFANVLAPHAPEVGGLGSRFRRRAWQVGGTRNHLPGTDHLGRDGVARIGFGPAARLRARCCAGSFAG